MLPIITDPAKETREVARRLWRGGLHRFTKHYPDWAFGTPEFEEATVTFVMQGGTGSIRARVESSRVPGKPRARGPNLQVVLLDDAGAPSVAGAFAEAIAAIDRAGHALELPAPEIEGNAEEKSGDPSWREIFIADTCNLKCSFCCESVRIGRGSLMSWEKMEATLRRYAEQGVSVVQFMGGEPSIHPNFADGLRLSRELGMRNYAITNLLQWRKRSFAEEVGPLLDELMISMHAHGEESGAKVTGREAWWAQFNEAVPNVRETLQGRVYGATVLSRHNVHDLERIAETFVSLRASKWVMGNSVPIAEAPLTSLEINLSLDEQRAEMDRFRELHKWTAERGCELIFFCMPDCVLVPDLWPASHDRMLHDQDLLGTGTAEPAESEVNFWSRTDFQDEAVRNVSLGRRYDEPCGGCVRRGTCGGYFDEYLTAKGNTELGPRTELPIAAHPLADTRKRSVAAIVERCLPALASEGVLETEAEGRNLVTPVVREGKRVGELRVSERRADPSRAEVRIQGDVPEWLRQRSEEIRATDRLLWPSRGEAGPLLVVTSGVPRSGTSWVARGAHGLLTLAGEPLQSGEAESHDFPSNAPDDEHAKRLEALVEGFCAHPDKSRSVKTHYVASVAAESAPVRTLYAYRHPYEVLTSTFHYAFAGPAAQHFAGRAPEDAFAELLERVVPNLRRSLEDASSASLPSTTHLVAYEALLRDPEQTWARIAAHLDVSLPAGFARAVARRYAFEREAGRPRGDAHADPTSYFRSGTVGAWESALPASLHAALRAALPDADALYAAVNKRAAATAH